MAAIRATRGPSLTIHARSMRTEQLEHCNAVVAAVRRGVGETEDNRVEFQRY